MPLYEGWEGSLLYAVETTPGTLVAPTLPFGVVKNFNARTSAQLEEEGAVGTYLPVSLEEGVIEAGGSCEFIPAGITSILNAKRNPSTGKLPSLSVHVALGLGKNHLGSKINQLRFSQEAGGRTHCNLDWFSIGSVPVAAIAAVVPTEEEMNWIKCVTNLEVEVYSWEFAISQNLQRRVIVPNATTVFPIPTQKRAAFAIREGRQAITFTSRFTSRPTAAVVADCVAALSDLSLAFVGCVGGTPLAYTLSASDGKPNVVEVNASEAGEGTWPIEFRYLDWDIALDDP